MCSNGTLNYQCEIIVPNSSSNDFIEFVFEPVKDGEFNAVEIGYKWHILPILQPLITYEKWHYQHQMNENRYLDAEDEFEANVTDLDERINELRNELKELVICGKEKLGELKEELENIKSTKPIYPYQPVLKPLIFLE